MLLLKNATIRSMAKAGTFDGSVLIKDGKIAEVSNVISLPECAACETLVVRNHLLMPGLI